MAVLQKSFTISEVDMHTGTLGQTSNNLSADGFRVCYLNVKARRTHIWHTGHAAHGYNKLQEETDSLAFGSANITQGGVCPGVPY